jgi:hypothetical protein
LYSPAEVGAGPVYVYDPLVAITVTILVPQPKTRTTFSLDNPPPFAVNEPETVTEATFSVAEAVSKVDTGPLSEPVLRLSVIVPGPSIETEITLLEPEQDNSGEQVQLEIE